MRLKKIENALLLALLFLLPWQTRYIWHSGQINGGYWEYGTFSIYAVEILLWFIIVLFFIRSCVNRRSVIYILSRKKYIYLSAIFFAIVGMSLVLSENFWVSYQYVFRWLGAVAGGIIVASNIREGLGNQFLFSIWVGGIPQGLLAIYQFLNQHIFGSKWLGMAAQEAVQGGASVVEFADQRWLRAYGSFGSPNSLGIYLAVLLILGFILYLKIERPVHKIFITVGQLIITSGLLLSFSRGAWAAAISGMLVLLFMIFCTRKDWRVFFIKQVVFVLVLTGFWVIIFYPVFSARFNVHNRLEARSIGERQSQYKEAVFFIKQNPFFGVGPGVNTSALAKKYPELASWQLQPVHNIYLLTTVEFGIFFSLFLAAVMFGLCKKIMRNNLFFLPVVITLLAAGLFDHWLYSMFPGLVLCGVVWGLSYGKTDS